MTTETQILTDEQIAQTLNDAGVTEYADVPLRYDLEIARAVEQAVLQAYESQLLRLLVNIRFAAGDDGKRMQDELVEHIKELKEDADRWRFARDLLTVDDIETAVENMRGFTPDPDESAKADAAIDAAMQEQKT